MPFSMHPSLHIYIMSKHFKCSLEKFDVDDDAIALSMPEHLPMFKQDAQVKVLEAYGKKYMEMLKAAMRNKDGNTRIHDHIVKQMNDMEELRKERRNKIQKLND